MVKVKYLGGVRVSTPLGLADSGTVFDVPEAVAERLSPMVWERVEDVDDVDVVKVDKKRTNK